MDIIAEFNKNEGLEKDFLDSHKKDIIEYVKNLAGDIESLRKMPHEMLEYAYKALKDYMIFNRNDIQGCSEAVNALLSTNVALDRDNLTGDIFESIGLLYDLSEDVSREDSKYLQEALTQIIDYIDLVPDENKKVDILVKLLEHPYVDLLFSGAINKKLTEYASDGRKLLRDSKELIVTRILDDYEDGELDENSHVFSMAEVVTRIAASIGDEEYTKEIINRSTEIFSNDYLRSYMPALLTLSDDKYCMEFIYNKAIEPEEIVKNVPLIVKKKKEFDRFLDDFTEGKTDRLLMIARLKNKRLQSYYKELKFRKETENMDSAEPCFANLPEGLRFGVEFEVSGLDPEEAREVFGDVDLSEWDIKDEPSIAYGFEIANARPFTDGRELGKICKMADILKDIGLKETEECGGHIHFDYGYFEDDGTGGVRSAINLAMIWREAEELFYKISNAPGNPTRTRIDKMGGTIDFFPAEYRNKDISDPDVQEEIMGRLKKTKEKGVNFSNIGDPDKNTIEFRIPNGTLDKEVLVQNIKLFGALMRVSKDMTLNPEKYGDKLSDYLDKDKTEREKLEALLSLLFESEDDKKIYRERWDSVKDEVVYDKVSDYTDETFRRGNYTLRDFARQQVHAVDAKDMTYFVKCMQLSIRARQEAAR